MNIPISFYLELQKRLKIEILFYQKNSYYLCDENENENETKNSRERWENEMQSEI